MCLPCQFNFARFRLLLSRKFVHTAQSSSSSLWSSHIHTNIYYTYFVDITTQRTHCIDSINSLPNRHHHHLFIVCLLASYGTHARTHTHTHTHIPHAMMSEFIYHIHQTRIINKSEYDTRIQSHREAQKQPVHK